MYFFDICSQIVIWETLNLWPSRRWLTPLGLLINLFSWFFLADVQEVGRAVFLLSSIHSTLCKWFMVLYIVLWGEPSFWKWFTISDFFICGITISTLFRRSSRSVISWFRLISWFNLLVKLLLVLDRCLKVNINLDTWLLNSVTNFS